MALNSTANSLPPLPTYKLEPLPPLLSPIPDVYLTLILPILAYWGLSMIFHTIDTFDLFPQYRLHTPAEVLKRNHVSRWEVVRDVVVQQVVQTLFGICLGWFEPVQLTGMDSYDVAVWAQRIRTAQRSVPLVLSAIGLDSQGLAQRLLATNPSMAGFLVGGQYPWLTSVTQTGPVAAFANWEMLAAKAIYWVLIPACQFAFAIMVVDTWQYFLHRAMHMNKWLYTKFHARHHRLYVPYAYGALYNHPFEGFLLDTLGTGLAYLVAGLTPRQSMWFFTCTTFKTVDDHCGYALPWDPLQHLTSNNAGYHDVHHQSWGIKTNFSQPFFTFWDRLLGTVWTGGDVSARYERTRLAAERASAITSGQEKRKASITASNPIDSALEASNKSPYTENDSSEVNSTKDRSRPQAPAGKAAAQATSSRVQVVTDPSPAGGSNILAEETAEEDAEAAARNARMRKSPRKREGSLNLQQQSSQSSGGSLKGLLRDRVGTSGAQGKGCSGHGLSVGYDGGR